MRNRIRELIVFGLCAGFSFLIACTSTVFPELDESDPVLVVDAFLTIQSDTQQVVITRSRPFFEQELNPAVTGAIVDVVNTTQQRTINFTETADGVYSWIPVTSDSLGVVGDDFILSMNIDGIIYQASSSANRVPQIDSIVFEFEEEDVFIAQDYFAAEFFAQDPVGPGDTYWIRGFKNGQLLNKPAEIITAFDAGFSEGGNIDGLTFILPIRRGINPFEEDPDNNGQFLPPYLPGDSVYVELHAITRETFNFINEVAIQTNRPGGFAELFAVPLANVSTNINSPDGAEPAVGFFSVSNFSSAGMRLVVEE